MKRKICVVTSSRADYGHLYWLLKEIQHDRQLYLQLIVTGAHLLKRHGYTYRTIIKDGFTVKGKVSVHRPADTDRDITRIMGTICSRMADLLFKLKPDVFVALGDRYEVFAASIAAYVAKVPIAHIHGGETTEGAFDEAFRHSITKMATVHFAATEEYRRRIIQLGEDPGRVFNFGAPGLDALAQLRLFSRQKVEDILKFSLDEKVVLVTYHPVTLEKSSPVQEIKNIVRVIQEMDLKALFTRANMDTGGNVINGVLEQFCRKDPQKYKFVKNLGQRLYYSCLKHFDALVGNSSSGLLEAPSFHIPVVNIGDRQKGRVRAGNVIDVKPMLREVRKGIQLALSDQFRQRIQRIQNPYMRYKDGHIGRRIKEKLKTMKFSDSILKKKFHSL